MYWDFVVPEYNSEWTLNERLHAIARANKGAMIPSKDLRIMLGMGDHGKGYCNAYMCQGLNYDRCKEIPHGFERVSKNLWKSIL